MRRALSFSPSPRDEQRLSTSSMKMMDGWFLRASSNSCFTSRSLSPWYLDTRSDEDTDRNVEPASVATAFAKKLLPVPAAAAHRGGREGREENTDSQCSGCVSRLLLTHIQRGWGALFRVRCDAVRWCCVVCVVRCS